MPEKYTDEALWAMVKGGNTVAFGILYDRYWQLLYNNVYWHIYDRDETKDILQDIFIKLWQKKAAINITSSLKAYLLSLSRHHTLNHIKSLAVRNKYQLLVGKSAAQTSKTTEEAVYFREFEELYKKETNQLPERMQEIFLLSRDEGKSVKEIATQLSISPQTVKNQLSIAIKKLRHTLEDYVRGK